MGTRAYWFRAKWRYRVIDAEGEPGPWLYADTLGDIITEVGDDSAQVQKRSSRGGRNGADYTYSDHSILNEVNRLPY